MRRENDEVYSQESKCLILVLGNFLDTGFVDKGFLKVWNLGVCFFRFSGCNIWFFRFSYPILFGF